MKALNERFCRKLPAVLAAYLLAAVAVMCLLLQIFGPVMITPEPVSVDYRTVYVISDSENMLNSTEQNRLHLAMTLFQEKTGSMPAIQIIPYERWSQYEDLHGYTYMSYHSMFQDEKHLMIVCAEPRTWESVADWKVDVVAGIALHDFLTADQAETMARDIQSALREKGSGIGTVIAESLETKATQLMMPRLDPAALSILVFGSLLFGAAIAAIGTALCDTVYAVQAKRQNDKGGKVT